MNESFALLVQIYALVAAVILYLTEKRAQMGTKTCVAQSCPGENKGFLISDYLKQKYAGSFLDIQ